MFKKLASIAIAATMMVGTAAITASAAEVESDAVGAEDSAVVSADNSSEVGADAGSEAVGAGNVINFDLSSAGWNNVKNVFCHIWAYQGADENTWQSKSELCKDNGDGTYSYDLSKSKVPVESGTIYAVVFSANTGMQTYDLIFDSSCIGDTAYCDGTTYENPKDSNKTGQAAFWKGQDKTKFGPLKQVTSIGNIVGTCIPATTSAYKMFTSFLTDNLTSAQSFSGKDDQTLLDDVAKELGLGQDDIEKAIKETGVKVSWKKSSSNAQSGSNSGAYNTPSGGSTGSGSNGGSSTGSGSGSSSSSGSGSSSVKSGVETTIFYVFGGLMLAAAGVAFLARKKREE